MIERVVVMGGSFNPPTRAHLQLMEAAMEAVQADHGVFAPQGFAYVARKMKRMRCPQDAMSDAVRTEMLESYCRMDDRLSVTRVQMEREDIGFDYEMLEEVQRSFPGAEVYFVTGSDKLFVLPRWHRIEELLDHFRVLVARRGQDDLEYIKTIRPHLAERWDRFAAFDLPAELAGVSSSLFRQKLHEGDESAKELVTEEVWEIMRKNGRLPGSSITDFHAPGYEYLSNFYEAKVEYGGLVFGTNEAAFQAQKCLDSVARAQFTEYSAAKSKGIGRRVPLRPDWEEVKYTLMEEIVRAKFTQHPELAARLLSTGDKVLVEGNHWGDTCWGVDTRTGQGENHLGQILMKVRAELKQNWGEYGSESEA